MEGDWELDYVGSGQFNEVGCILVGFRGGLSVVYFYVGME